MQNLKVSIVIPTIGRRDLTLIMQDLDEQTYKDYELIVVREGNICEATNTALGMADGEIFTRIDDDVRLNTRWLEGIVYTFTHCPSIGGMTGPTIIPEGLMGNRDIFKGETNRLIRWAYYNYLMEGQPYAPAKMFRSGAFSIGSNFERVVKEMKGITECDYLNATNLSLRTELVRRVGGFDTKFGGVCDYYEQDVVYKVRELGYKMYYNPRAIVYHLVGKGGADYGRRDFRNRMGNFIRFYMRHIKPNTPSKVMRFLTYLLFQGAYYGIYQHTNIQI